MKTWIWNSHSIFIRWICILFLNRIASYTTAVCSYSIFGLLYAHSDILRLMAREWGVSESEMGYRSICLYFTYTLGMCNNRTCLLHRKATATATTTMRHPMQTGVTNFHQTTKLPNAITIISFWKQELYLYRNCDAVVCLVLSSCRASLASASVYAYGNQIRKRYFIYLFVYLLFEIILRAQCSVFDSW